MRGLLLIVCAAGAACGGPPPSRAELGIVPEQEAICMHGGKAILLSKYEGGHCGTTPASAPPEPTPTCDDLAVTFGCK